jgi:hypothetical protein
MRLSLEDQARIRGLLFFYEKADDLAFIKQHIVYCDK